MAKQKKIIELVVESAKAVTGLGKTSQAMKEVGGASKTVSTGFKAIGVSIKALGLGALVGLLTLVFEAFKRNQVMQDLIARGFDLIQRAVNVVVKGFQFALIVTDKLTFGMLNLAGASDSASASLQRQRNEVRLLQAQEQLVTLQFQKNAEIQRQIRDDESRSLEERTKANEELGRILDEQHSVEMANAQRFLEVAEKELELDEHNIELQERVIQAKTKVAEVDERITGQRSEMLMNINSLNRENLQLAKTSGGVASAVREEVKSYEDLNREMKTALGLDTTVESITKRIADAHKIRAEEIKKEEEELKKLEKSEKNYRRTSTKGLKDLKKEQLDLNIKFREQSFILTQMQQEGESELFIMTQQHIVDELKERIRINDEAQAEEERKIESRNARNIARVDKHNADVQTKIEEHNQKVKENEERFNNLIAEARQQATAELDYFLGTEQEKELMDLDQQYIKRLDMVLGNKEDELRLEEWYYGELFRIQQEGEDALIEGKRQAEQEKFDLESQNIDRTFAVASSLVSSLGKLASDDIKTQKKFALLGITIDTASAISSAIRGAVKNSAGNPVLTPILIAELLAIVFGGMAQAKGLLASVPGGGGSDDGSSGLQSLQSGVSVGSPGDAPRLPTDDILDMDLPPVQAFVVESNVTGKQALQNDLEVQATL